MGEGDHPRVCGKDDAKGELSLSSLGSPPRMRERLAAALGDMGQNGITPAYAGKTRKFAKATRQGWDHPRVCGKDLLFVRLLTAGIGSPPRMRERHDNRRRMEQKNRITPAYAGKTHLAPPSTQQGRDHPRVCGKDLSCIFFLSFNAGSPPRMRERHLKIPIKLPFL